MFLFTQAYLQRLADSVHSNAVIRDLPVIWVVREMTTGSADDRAWTLTL